MIAKNKSDGSDEFTERIMAGINKALYQLVEKSAAKNDSLVIGDAKGNFKSVPAREILKTLSK